MLILYHFHSLDNSEDSPEVRFICGTAVPLKVELPTQIPLGLQLIEAKIKSGIHHAVLCSCSSITKGTRYGPYKGTAVKPSDTANGGDTAFMWEVRNEWKVTEYTKRTQGFWFSLALRRWVNIAYTINWPCLQNIYFYRSCEVFFFRSFMFYCRIIHGMQFSLFKDPGAPWWSYEVSSVRRSQ